MTTNEHGFESSAADVAPTVEERAADVASMALEEAKAAAAKAGEPWTDPGEELATLATLVDPANVARWLLLANRIGATSALKMLAGGVRGVRGLDAAEKAVEAELARDGRDAEFNKGQTPMTAEELASHKGRVPLLTVGGIEWLPGGVVGLVVVGGGTGKTTWLAELAVRVSHGKNWPGLWDLARDAHGAPVKGPVLLVMAEEDRDGAAVQIKRALQRLAEDDLKAEAPKDAPRVHVWAGAEHHTALGEVVQLDDPVRGRVTTVIPSKFHDALCRKAVAEGPLLVILDPLNQLLPTGGSENDAVTAGALIRLAGEIRAAAERGRAGKGGPRPVVLIAHHERKAATRDSGSDAARGSTAFIDNARWALGIHNDNVGKMTRTTFEVTKSNYTRQTAVLAKREYVAGGGIKWSEWGKVEVAAFRAAELAKVEEDAKRKKEEDEAKRSGRAAPANAPATSGAAGWADDEPFEVL